LDGAKLVCVTAVANTLGTVTPLKEIIDLAHQAGARVLVDGAQAAPHLALDVAALDCDFLAFTGHKVYGPDGIGVLHGKAALLEQLGIQGTVRASFAVHSHAGEVDRLAEELMKARQLLG